MSATFLAFQIFCLFFTVWSPRKIYFFKSKPHFARVRSPGFQCLGVLLIWIIVGQRPIALAVGAVGGCLDIFSLVYHFSFLSHSLWETARYRLKYCLKGPLAPKQPTNQPKSFSGKQEVQKLSLFKTRGKHGYVVFRNLLTSTKL